MRWLRPCVLAAVLLVLAAGSARAEAPDPIVGRWEFATPDGRPFGGGPVYDIVATGNGSFTTRVVRNWAAGCQVADGQLRLTRIASAAAQAAYRGTAVVLTPPLCRATGEVEVELVLAGGAARLFFKDAAGTVQHYRLVSLRIDVVLPTFRERIERAEASERARVAELEQRFRKLDASITTLEAEARRQLDTAPLQARIENLGAELARIAVEIERVDRAAAKAPNDPKVAAFRDGWERRAMRIRGRLFDAEASLHFTEQQQRRVEAELQHALAERSVLDAELVELARRLSGVDFDVREISATSGGRLVFRAVASTKTARELRSLDERIATARRAVATLESERAAAKTEFLRAQQAVLAAGERLQSLFWTNFAKTAAIEVGFLALDLGVASLRGGFIGLAAEVGKKSVEAAIFNVAFRDKGGPDELEAQLRAEYGAQLSDSFSPAKIKRVGVERTLKETALKAAVKDPLTKNLVAAVSRREWAFARAKDLGAGATAAELRGLERSGQLLRQARARLQDFTVRQRAKPGLGRGLAESVVKDAAKLLLKRQLELAEREAWIDYFEKDIWARAAYPLLPTASNAYWKAKDALDRLIGIRARTIALRPDLAITVNEPFARGIPLVVTLRGEGRPGPLVVVLGGSRAVAGKGFVYQVDTAPSQLDSAGRLVLEIR